MRARYLCALCGPIASILLSGALCGCNKEPSGTHRELAGHALSSKQPAADAPLANTSAAAPAAHGHAMTAPPGHAIALGLDDGSTPSVLDRVEIHK